MCGFTGYFDPTSNHDESIIKEMSNQIGNKKLNGSDINNTYNGSLKTLGN